MESLTGPGDEEGIGGVVTVSVIICLSFSLLLIGANASYL